MTSRRVPSLRKDARGRYLVASADACDGACDSTAPSLTDRVGALYESAVISVREIARLVGVTERTVYKYAHKRGWQRRVRRLKPRAGGGGLLPVAGIAALWREGLLPVREIARLAGVSDVTIYNHARRGGWQRRVRRLVQGAGGRFTRFEDEGLPFARGIKAVDPRGAARAAERCVAAGALADNASASAVAAARERAAREQAERAMAAQVRDFGILCGALVELAKCDATRRRDGSVHDSRAGRLADRLARAIVKQMERMIAAAR